MKERFFIEIFALLRCYAP